MPAPDRDDAARQLAEGCRALNLTLDQERLHKLLDYLALLQRWNSAFNLTAVRDPSQMVTRHLLDSLSVSPLLCQTRLIDVGAGAGLPGIPLAIADPARRVTLLDSNGKKTRFMFQALNTLELDNCEVVHARAERWQPERRYEAVISRAFASLSDMIDTCAHLVDADGVLLAMKGQYPAQELAEIQGRADLLRNDDLAVPGLEGARCLLTLQLRG